MIDTFLKLHAAYENMAQRILLKEFRRIGNRITFDILTPDNARTIIGLAVNDEEMEKALFKVHYTIGKSYGNIEARAMRRDVKKFKPLPLFNEAFQLFLLNYYKDFGGENITLLTETYIDAVVAEIRKPTESNETVIQMRERIYKTVNRPDFYRWQALRIARTETTFAMNQAKYIAGEVSGAVMEKVWVAKIDNRTRDPHAFMNGKVADQTDFFDVDGEKMLFPGDKLNGASAGNLISCRCGYAYQAKRDAEGRRIWND